MVKRRKGKTGYRILYKSKFRKRFAEYGFATSKTKKSASKKLAKEKKKFPALRDKHWKFKIVKK